MSMKTKLRIKIVQPPISIFEMVKGKQDVDRTLTYESAFDDAAHFYFMVPDGVYLVTQGARDAAQPCVYEVSNGQVKVKRVTKAPVGNTVEDMSKPAHKPYKDSVAKIMHTKK